MSRSVKRALARMAEQGFPDESILREAHQGRSMKWSVVADADASATQSSTTLRTAVFSRRRVWIAATFTAVAAAGAALVVPMVTSPTSYAETAAMLDFAPLDAETSPERLLQDLALRAARQPVPAAAEQFHYVRTRTWALSMSVTTDMDVLDVGIVDVQRERWVAEDGSGRLEMLEDGVRTLESGVTGPNPGGWPKFDTSTTLRTPQAKARSTAEWFDATRQLWNSQVVTPDMQSAILDVLAVKSGIVVEGVTTDRAGRQGVAISTLDNSDRALTPNERYVMILDLDTGMLLGYEQVAMEDGGLPIQTPSTIAYMVWLTSGYAADANTRP